MRRFVVETVLGALILFVVVAVLSFVNVPQPFPFGTTWAPIFVTQGIGLVGYLVAGAILAVANRFVRPFIVALTGRFLLSSLGLFVVVINAILLWVGSLFAPDLGALASPFMLWFFVTAALYTLLAAVVNAVLGLNRPHLQQAEGNRDLWRLLESMPTPRRNVILENLRLKQVYDMIYATALDSWLARTPLGPVRQWFTRVVLREEEPATATGAEQLRQLFQRLGPTYVKIGQMMASRADVLPPDIIAELSKLQSEASPFPWEDARAVIAGELGKPPEELFASIETEPFAAASTAQVHRATLADGTLVAVKVQRPRIVAKTKADLGVMSELAGIAERRIALARKVGVRAMVDEFARGVLKELDYRNEAYHAKRLADNMARFPEIRIPVIFDDLSGARVLTMEFVRGEKVSHVDALRAAGFDTAVLGNAFIRAVIKQVLVDGFFHGDPHPGNLLADPATKRLVFLDLGLVGQLSSTQRVDLLGLIYAVKEVDIPAIADGLIALGTPTKGYDGAGFRADIDRLARQYLVYGRATSFGAALGGFTGAVFNNGLRLDSSLTLAIKAIVQAEETATALSPDVDLGEAAIVEAQAALLDSLDPDKVLKRVRSSAARVSKELARRAPSMEDAALKWLDMFNRGRLTVELDTSDLTRSLDKVGGLGRQATIGIIVVGQLIGTAIVMVIFLQPAAAAYAGFATLAMLAFIGALLVSFVVLFRMLFGRADEAD